MSLFLLLWPILLFLLPVDAQTGELFQWSFSNNFLSTSLPSCQSFGITVQPYNPANDTSSLYTAPFYMISFEAGGTPRTTLIGTTNTSLSWTVDHPVGAKLMLLVVDANGSSGGVPPQIYSVVTGQTTSCIRNTSSSDFTVRANVTDTIQTCQPWGLRISGGVPPYNLTLAALNSPNVTNVTILGVDDAFTYIDRADPNIQLIAAISDLTGRWASGTPIVNTTGSTNVDCVGLVSSSGNGAALDQAARDEAAAADASQKRRISLIIGLSVTFSVLFLIALTFGTVTYMRRRAAMIKRMSARNQLDLSIKPFEDGLTPTTATPSTHDDTPGTILSINNWIDSTQPTVDSPTAFSGAASSYADEKASILPGSGSTATAQRRPGFANFPVRNGKSQHSITGSVDSARPLIGSGTLSRGASANSSEALGDSPGSSGSGMREYVIQHQDGGGAVVRELPPPYVDRSAQLRKEEEDAS